MDKVAMAGRVQAFLKETEGIDIPQAGASYLMALDGHLYTLIITEVQQYSVIVSVEPNGGDMPDSEREALTFTGLWVVWP